ncbi:MAG: helix-turn-helix domain-containing protein [Agathobacter sp.]
MGFSDRLKYLRKRNGYTQKQLADMLNVSQNAIYNWENGKREPSINTMIKIADSLGVGIFDLIEIESEPLTDEQEQELIEKQTTGAHFNLDEYTIDEIEKIKEYASFLKSQRKVMDELKDLKFPDQPDNSTDNDQNGKNQK